MILCGDIGATKSLLGLAERAGGGAAGALRLVLVRRYENDDWGDFAALVDDFLGGAAAAHRPARRLRAAGFGVAGPVADERVSMTNRPWLIDAAALGVALGVPVCVLNDFEASASGIADLDAAGRLTLQAGEPRPGAPQLVIGAGSGLGVAVRLAASPPRVIPGEGGHVGFAPANDEQAGLWRHLRGGLGRVSAEHVVSGPGLVRIHDWIDPPPEALPATAHRGERVWQLAAAGDAGAMRALDLFVDCYGAVAGDHALTVLARGGVFLTGGIAPQLLPAAAPRFLAAFHAKGPHTPLMAKMPVHVVTDGTLPLLGAARAASTLARR